MIEKLVFCTLTLLAITCNCQLSSNNKIVCYYDSRGHSRGGQAQFDNIYLAEPLQFCTHLIYGFAGINADTKKLVSLDESFDISGQTGGNYRHITNLKRQYPGLRVLLSVGGGRDLQKAEKYLTLLESEADRSTFVNSAHDLVKSYGFDGLDLAWEFPQNKPKKIRGFFGNAWSTIKHTFVNPSEIDEKHEQHQEQFTELVRDLKTNFRHDGLLLSMSVLPNVNSSLFHNVRALTPNLDFINLWAFDYYTPERNPKEADYPAPLYELIDRKFDENANYLVNHWLQNGAPNNKLILGIPTYGRTWKMTADSGSTGVPPISETKGGGEAGLYTNEEGILSYQEICAKVANPNNIKGNTLTKTPDREGKYGIDTEWTVIDVTKRYGTYAFRVASSSGDGGIWVGYEDTDSAGSKAAYVRNKGLGGVAVVDLTLDDFRGLCTGNKYPLLRAIKSRL